MAIIIEDGSIVENANSYVTEAELTDYATARGVTLTGTPESLLILSMDYIESQNFLGSKVSRDQELQWPRSGVYVDGFLIASDEIPKELKRAQLATALAEDMGNSPLAVVSPAVKREKVDVIETEYQDGAISNSIDPAINASLKKLISGGSSGGIGFVSVTRV